MRFGSAHSHAPGMAMATLSNADAHKIATAALAWARAERVLRNRVNFVNALAVSTGEERHRIVLASDATEQALLDTCEAVLRERVPTPKVSAINNKKPRSRSRAR